MQRTFAHSVTYTNTGRVPVGDVAASLLANERLVREALASLEDLFPGLTVEDVEVVFRRASSDSPLQEAIEAIGNIIFQEDLAHDVPDLVRQLTGLQIPESMDSMITLLVIAIVLFGVSWVASKAKKKDAAASPTLSIEGNYNQVVQVASLTLAVQPSEFKAAVEGRFTRGRANSIARKALEFIRPAQREDGAAIEGGGVRITPEAIAEAPSALELELADDEEIQEPYTDQEIAIHATDLDHSKSGWAGHLPGVWEKRLPMRLYPTIRPEQLFGKRSVMGDIILVSRRSSSGEYVPYVFHVVGVDD